MNIHEKYINRCIQLARNGTGRTWPNPLVGSVVVHNDRIIGEGWHQRAGEAHAEVNAILSVHDRSLLKNAVIYVSLEPCSHYGKTPPCSDLIIENGLRRVIIGTVDPYAEVEGRGIMKLMDAGCEVTVGVLEQQCKELNQRFFTYHTSGRPYVILKWAESRDGFIAPPIRPDSKRAPTWISNKFSRQLVHKWRSEEQAILVGTNTAVHDNPKLNTRDWTGPDPIRVVLDRELRIPEESYLLDGSTRTIVLTESHSGKDSRNLIFERISFSGNLAAEICRILFQHGIQSVIVEGGRKTLQSFIDSGLWDEARVISGESELKNGIRSPEFCGILKEKRDISGDILKVFRHD